MPGKRWKGLDDSRSFQVRAVGENLRKRIHQGVHGPEGHPSTSEWLAPQQARRLSWTPLLGTPVRGRTAGQPLAGLICLLGSAFRRFSPTAIHGSAQPGRTITNRHGSQNAVSKLGAGKCRQSRDRSRGGGRERSRGSDE